MISISNNSGSSSCRQSGQLSPPEGRQHSLVSAQLSFPMTVDCELFWKGQCRLPPMVTNVLCTLTPALLRTPATPSEVRKVMTKCIFHRGHTRRQHSV